MRKFSFMMLLAALFITTASVEAKSSSCKKASAKNTKCCASKASRYRAYAKGYMAKAQKAEAAGNKKLADLFKQCAEAKSVMADGLEGKADRKAVKAANVKYNKAAIELKKIKKSCCKKAKKCSKAKKCKK